MSLYLVFVLYMVFWSQARCASGKYVPDTHTPKPLNSITEFNKDDMPENWSEAALPDESYRVALGKNSTALLTLPAAAPEGLKKVHRLEAQQSVVPVDPMLLTITQKAQKAHDRANFAVRKTAMRAGGVPLYASSRSSSSSSSSYSSHK